MASKEKYNCRGESRYIPAEIRRSVRQNAFFGCAACGCPVIEYHHIVPFSEIQEHTAENIVALCPTCHKRADFHGQWGEDLVRIFKQNSHNQDETKDKFIILTPDFQVKMGRIGFLNCSELIALRDERFLSCNRSPEGIIKISGKFQDESGVVVAVVEDNEWRVDVNTVWDVEYIAARRLIIRTGPGNVVLRMEITDTELAIQQCFFRKDNLRLTLKGDERHTDLSIQASGPTFFRSRNERVVFQGPLNGPALRLV